MSPLTDQQLLDFNAQGLIPGPKEKEEEFVTRAQYCLTLHKTLTEHLGEDIPFTPQESATLSIFRNASKKTHQLYDFIPDWIPIFFSNSKLAPWHGGCAWIFQLTDDTPTSALLQLRKSLHHSQRLLGYYDRDELIAHELAHVGRMMFEEPAHEELLAYRTATSPLRRWLGPIIQSSMESFLFVTSLVGILIIDFYLLFWHSLHSYLQAQWLKCIPLAMIGYASFRLWLKQRAFHKCLKKLISMIGQQKANAVIYRLTDKEIKQFSKMKTDDISNFIKQRKETSLRWRLIYLYFCALYAAEHSPD